MHGKAYHTARLCAIVLVVVLTFLTGVLSKCAPEYPCQDCGYHHLQAERDAVDCRRYYYCFFGRLWANMTCGIDQIYSLQKRSCVAAMTSDDCKEPIVSQTKAESRTQNPAQSTTATTPPVKTWSLQSQINDGCGITISRRIVGGSKTFKGAWPWQVSIQTIDTNTGILAHLCGATLIFQDWIVTAAHCMVRITNLRLIAVFGSYNLAETTPGQLTRRIVKVIRHRGFRNLGNYPDDIALLRLSSSVPNSRSIRCACLPPQGENVEVRPAARKSYSWERTANIQSSNKCWVTGWGVTLGNLDQYTLNEVKVNLVDQQLCQKEWQVYSMNNQLCAGQGNKGACSGDSGGPLVCSNAKRDGRFYLEGIVSWGEASCRKKRIPNVFTRVSQYTDWIIDTINAK